MEINSLISQIKALSLLDLNLEPAIETAQKTLGLAVVKCLVAAHPLNKFWIYASIKEAWNFIKKFLIEDLEVNMFFFAF